ncbi:peptidoglycan bridge formation glycyltransferase FemA/FemB family protein [Flavobacterium sp.]|uniref:lipid II:glycine glycyltransferase FemX n=1 Tax=Flavobacterium sp. TaxID=239 RepID=UPI0025ED33A5|nr:peptidoglycan bridge formation glycyltransferase FemA/FemB family protein [Flavobacterium sp.]
MELIVTSEASWLKKWDAFVIHQNKACHLNLSAWNSSFLSYGFQYEIVIAIENGEIIGGYTAVIAKVALFKFYIVPYGPIIIEEKINQLNSLIEYTLKRAKHHKTCYIHINLPCTKQINSHTYNHLPKIEILDEAAIGHLFKYVYSSSGINWKSVDGYENEEALIMSFKPSVRRYIRSSQRKGLALQLAIDEETIKKGYQLCLENAKNKGYSLRDWNSFKDTIINLVFANNAKFLLAVYDGQIKGAALIIKAGNYYSYILGGTVKEKPDFLAGHFLHYEAIKMAYTEKLSGYNISLGGSKGVVSLKESYADAQLYFKEGQYHWILKPLQFKLFLLVEKHFKKHKKTISKLLSFLKK